MPRFVAKTSNEEQIRRRGARLVRSTCTSWTTNTFGNNNLNMIADVSQVAVPYIVGDCSHDYDPENNSSRLYKGMW